MKNNFLYGLVLLIGTAQAFKLGIEQCPRELAALKKMRIGLITNQSGVDQSGHRSIDILRRRRFNVTALFAPEHGLDGTVPAGERVDNAIDAKTHLPVFSLYQSVDKQPIANSLLDKIDVLFFDIQDSGMRHYTYISTLYQLLELCGKNNKPIVVFDRPNPLGVVMEGPLVDPRYHSFVSVAPIPLRHGMTIGELARYFNTYHIKPAAPLTVIGMHAYRRNERLHKLPTKLSPCIPNLESCYGYSFMGLLEEIDPVLKTGGLDKPFRYLATDEQQPLNKKQIHTMRKILRTYHIDSSTLIIKRGQQKLQAVLTTITGINLVSSFGAFMDIARYLNNQHIELTFKPIFDKAAGTDLVQKTICSTYPRAAFAKAINRELEEFLHKAQSCLLYTPQPKIMPLSPEDWA